MNNTNCESLYDEYRELKEKIRLIIDSNTGNKYNYIDSKDVLRIKYLAKKLVNDYKNYVNNLSRGGTIRSSEWIFSWKKF